MKQETFEIEKCCRYCENASVLSDEDVILCSKRGIMPSGKVCRAFAYDPLKRDPKRRRSLPGEDDFSELILIDNSEESGTDTQKEGNSDI